MQDANRMWSQPAVHFLGLQAARRLGCSLLMPVSWPLLFIQLLVSERLGLVALAESHVNILAAAPSRGTVPRVSEEKVHSMDKVASERKTWKCITF